MDNLGFGSNPYIQKQAAALQNLSNQNLSQNVMPAIGSAAQMAGGYGGSRHGVAQGVAAGNAQTGLDAATSNLYSNAYGQDQNFYTQQRGQDQNGAQIGANIYSMGNAGNLGLGAGQYGLGQQYQNAPLGAVQNYSNTISPYSGLGSAQTDTRQQGGGFQGIAGGALAGAQIGRNLGFGGGYSNPTWGNSSGGWYYDK